MIPQSMDGPVADRQGAGGTRGDATRHEPTHKHQWYINRETYKARNLVERTWCRIRDFRRIATRYDKLARNFASSVALAAVIIWWAD
jgi:transposase